MFRPFFLALFLLAAPALAASQLDAVRASATTAREAVNAVRADQMARRTELSQLSARIEGLKARSTGKLLPGGELDAALKQSQELSNQLTGLAQTMTTREAELESANLALLTELSAELGRLRTSFDTTTDRQARMVIIKRLRTARAEREQVRALLPATRVPAMLSVKPSDDPEDLLEQADLMRDREDQVRKELKTLEVRIAERRDERDLDRRVNQFLGDESFFDDSDRRLRVRRETTIPADAKTETQTASGFSADPGTAPNKSPTTRSQVGVPYDSASDIFGGGNGLNTMGAAAPSANSRTDSPAPQSPAPPQGGAGGNESDSSAGPTVKVSTGSDARPQVGKKTIAGGEDEDLEDLEIQRVKLKGLAEELKAKAKQLEKKASELR